MDELVSIVVIGRDEGDRLRRCLESVAAIDRSGFRTEVIYVDSGSRDGSVALAESHGAHVIALKPERPSAALGRNAGWRAARGSAVMFLDGDTVLHPRFIADSLPQLEQGTTAVVWGHRRELFPERSLYQRVLDLDWIYAPGLTLFCGGDALMRRQALEHAGGFDASLIAGEEPELCRRIAAQGYTILHVDRPMTGHDLAISRWSQYWKRATRAGHAYAEVSTQLAARGQTFWQDEVRRNRIRALVLMITPAAGLLLSVLLRDMWPALVALVFLAAISLRSAWKARWKSENRLTLLEYGVHSHLQQIPIYFGARRFYRNRRRGKQTGLVEYK